MINVYSTARISRRSVFRFVRVPAGLVKAPTGRYDALAGPEDRAPLASDPSAAAGG
jgi:hypothetical protein